MVAVLTLFCQHISPRLHLQDGAGSGKFCTRLLADRKVVHNRYQDWGGVYEETVRVLLEKKNVVLLGE